MDNEEKLLRNIVKRKRRQQKEAGHKPIEAGQIKVIKEPDTKSEDERLVEALKWRRRSPRMPGTEIGTVLERYAKASIKPKMRKASPVVAAWNDVVKAWQEVLPPGIEQYCKIDKVQGGIITVLVTDAAFRYQLQMMKHELIAALGERCKRIKVKDIRIKTGRMR